MFINAFFLNNSVNFPLESLSEEKLNGKNAEQINLLFIIARNMLYMFFIYIHCYFYYMLFMNCNIKHVINKYIINLYFHFIFHKINIFKLYI